MGPARAISRPRPTTELDVRMATHRNGDVAARVAVRFDEIARVAAADRALILAALPDGRRSRRRCRRRRADAFGIGWVEGWRGEVLVALESGPDGTHPALPSARSVVAELAGARARGDRQHRPRLPADQQVVQPVATAGTTSSERPHAASILRQIAAIGIKTEPAPQPDEALRVVAQRLQARGAASASGARSRSATSTPARATAASSRSTRSTIRTTTSKGSASASSRARGTPTCCSSPARCRGTWRSRCSAPTTRRPSPSSSSRSAIAAVHGLLGESYASLGRVANVIPVDVAVPGCPPTPTRSCRASSPRSRSMRRPGPPPTRLLPRRLKRTARWRIAETRRGACGPAP